MELRVNLKVCEGCGCLWYRAQVETRVYCTSCNERFKEFPTPQSRKRRGRPKKTTLPTVFAVQASAQFNPIKFNPEASQVSALSENVFRFEHEGLQLRRERDAVNPEGVPVALLASEAALFATRAALAGGAN